MVSFIELECMRFFAYHGVLPQERIVGNNYEVSLRVGFDVSRAAESDDLSDTLSYALLYDLVKREMNQPAQLLEHVAGRIVKAIRREVPACTTIRIRISKLTPPIAGEIGAATVEIND